jgi:hypothetical protein
MDLPINTSLPLPTVGYRARVAGSSFASEIIITGKGPGEGKNCREFSLPVRGPAPLRRLSLAGTQLEMIELGGESTQRSPSFECLRSPASRRGTFVRSQFLLEKRRDCQRHCAVGARYRRHLYVQLATRHDPRRQFLGGVRYGKAATLAVRYLGRLTAAAAKARLAWLSARTKLNRLAEVCSAGGRQLYVGFNLLYPKGSRCGRARPCGSAQRVLPRRLESRLPRQHGFWYVSCLANQSALLMQSLNV